MTGLDISSRQQEAIALLTDMMQGKITSRVDLSPDGEIVFTIRPLGQPIETYIAISSGPYGLSAVKLNKGSRILTRIAAARHRIGQPEGDDAA